MISLFRPIGHFVPVYLIAALACALAASALFAPAYAHTLDSVGDYRLELQWEVEPPYSGEVNAIKLFVSPLVPGLELEEQPFQNGVEGLEDTIKLQLASRDHTITLLPEADDQIPGLYRAYVLVLRPGFYQVNVVGEIEGTIVSQSLHPHEVRNADFITFPSEYGDVHELEVAQQNIAEEQQALRAGLEEAASATERQEDLVRSLESRLDESAGTTYLAVVPGVAGVILGGVAVFAARRSKA